MRPDPDYIPAVPHTVLWDLGVVARALRSRDLRGLRAAGMRNEVLDAIAAHVEHLRGQVEELLGARNGEGAPKDPRTTISTSTATTAKQGGRRVHDTP